MNWNHNNIIWTEIDINNYYFHRDQIVMILNDTKLSVKDKILRINIQIISYRKSMDDDKRYSKYLISELKFYYNNRNKTTKYILSKLRS